MHCGSADGRSGPAMLAACEAESWLARNAAGVKVIRNQSEAPAPACTSLVSCLPALEDVELSLCAPVVPEDLGDLLEALEWCPDLGALDLNMSTSPSTGEGYTDLHWAFPAPALAKLSSLTSLELGFDDNYHYTLADVVGALVALTGLFKLCIGHFRAADIHLVPAALGQLKALRSLTFCDIDTCVLEAGCLDLPELQSLYFDLCGVPDAAVLPGVSALQCLTAIEFAGGLGPLTVDPLAQLPGLQRLVLSQELAPELLGPLGPLRLPADMGSLSSTLLYLDISGHMGIRFPQALTQLVALEHLNAKENDFAEVPAGITALSRLTELMLGRICLFDGDPLQLHAKRPLDVRALGDLSRFPALRGLTFEFCEVLLCCSVLGSARHSSLTSLCFYVSHPAPECALVVLQLSRELWRMKRGSVLKAVSWEPVGYLFARALRDAQGRAPFQKFTADLEA